MLALTACASSPPADPVIALITLDTFRADHLGAIGTYERPGDPPSATPNLDALAARGRLFRQGVAEVPLTLPSHAGMLTGRSALELGLTANHHVLPPDARTAPQALSDAGWRTGAFVSSAVLRESAGLGRGFDRYDDSLGWRSWLPDPPHERDGGDTVDRALGWLDGASGPTFLWVHLYDPHFPYAPPPPFDGTFDPTAGDARGNEVEVRESLRSARRRLLAFVPRDLRRVVAAYGGEIAWADHQVGRLLDALPEGATVVVAADHGESLTEHGYLLNHGVMLYQPSLHVPIIVAGPAVAPAVSDAPAPLQRVGPTLRALAGLPPGGETLMDAPPEVIESFSTPRHARRALAKESAWLVSWREGSEKWIVGSDGGVERYELAVDPGELMDTAPEHPSLEDARARGEAMITRVRAADRSASVDPDGGVREALEALGYVE